MSRAFWAGRLVAHRIKWRGSWYHRLHRAGVALGLVAVPVFRVSPYVEAITLETEAALDDLWRAVNAPAIEVLANGNVRVNDPLYTPVWSVAEDDMARFVTTGEAR